ncbi:cytochrome c [Roseimaritima sediminicola]|uniref:cytochrome c n=1 Tax=Roseimaritima sediminicola TaxID=2662066 RepID=UPI001F3ABA07|nr:cytochrome c [Roseimaritima sediminicola]
MKFVGGSCSPCRSAPAAVLLMTILSLPLLAGERRARPPSFEGAALDSVFYENLGDAVRATRPSVDELHSGGAAAMVAAQAADGGTAAEGGAAETASEGWSQLISPVSLEDEIKRLKLKFDEIVTTPGPFKSGGYQDARVNLSILAMLFAVISEYDGDVRWKEESAAARDLLARTAFNSKAGSIQVYNEAKLRKADLQDIVSGAGLNSRDAEDGNDWVMIVDRSPLMEYLDFALYEQMSPGSNTPAAVAANADSLRRYAEMVALVGEVLTKEGMDDADDEDYQLLSKAMTNAALDVRAALEREDAEGVGVAIGAIEQSCSACHEQFR